VAGCWPRFIGPLTLFGTLSALPAGAQTASERFELFVGAGVSRMGGDEGSLGSGGTLTAGTDARIVGGLLIGTDALHTRHERQIAGGRLEGTATGVVANLTYRFRPESGVQPFALVSLGAVHFSTTQTYPASFGLVSNHSSETQKAWGGGGGVSIALTPHLLLRPQFRLLFAKRTGVLGLATTSLAASCRW
jgi:opacity protein-like surface antigen